MKKYIIIIFIIFSFTKIAFAQDKDFIQAEIPINDIYVTHSQELKNLSIVAHYISEQDKKIEAQQTYIASVHSQLNIIYMAIIIIMLWIIAEILIFLTILKKI